MSNVKFEITYSTCFDERYPPSAAIDGKPNTFFVTTGLFPQEIIVGVKAGAANIKKLQFLTSGVKKLIVHKCLENTPTRFDPLLEADLPLKEGQPKQLEMFAINETTVGAKIRFLKLQIDSAYEDFAAIYEFSAEGVELDDE